MQYLDLFRSKLLKETLKVSFLRSLFLSRSNRIFSLFLCALIFYFVVSSFFPLWVLLIGPILWGVPHLLSSLRYSTYSFDQSAKKKLLTFQFIIWAAVFSYRLANDIFFKELYLSDYPLLFESLCVLLSFGFQLYLFKKINLKLLLSFLSFSALIGCTYYYPVQTALTALIGHNYLPLVAWYKSCQNKKDLKVFALSTALYLALSLVIYQGYFDFAYNFITPVGSIAFLKWDFSQIALPYVTGDFDMHFWFHIVSLYAFSQAMHYFMWMKAIPENYQKQEYPPSFKWSFNRLAADFGFGSVALLALLSLSGILFWAFFEFQTARVIYFSIASYHGFMEISNVPFLKSNRKTNER